MIYRALLLDRILAIHHHTAKPCWICGSKSSQFPKILTQVEKG